MKKQKLQQTQWKYKRDYYKQLHCNTMDNLEQMEKFLEKCSIPKLNQEEIENMNRPIISNETKTVIKNSQQAKV